MSSNKSRGTPRNHTFDSNGPGIRVRGNAHQVVEKYQAMARDAAALGDRVLMENYLQHAEHYYRIILAQNLLNPARAVRLDQGNALNADGMDDYFDDEDGDVDLENGEAVVTTVSLPQSMGGQSSGSQSDGEYYEGQGEEAPSEDRRGRYRQDRHDRGDRQEGRGDRGSYRDRGDRDRGDRGGDRERNDRNDRYERNDSRYDNRGDGRNDNRNDGRNDNRSDNRNEGRREGRRRDRSDRNDRNERNDRQNDRQERFERSERQPSDRSAPERQAERVEPVPVAAESDVRSVTVETEVFREAPASVVAVSVAPVLEAPAVVSEPVGGVVDSSEDGAMAPAEGRPRQRRRTRSQRREDGGAPFAAAADGDREVVVAEAVAVDLCAPPVTVAPVPVLAPSEPAASSDEGGALVMEEAPKKPRRRRTRSMIEADEAARAQKEAGEASE